MRSALAEIYVVERVRLGPGAGDRDRRRGSVGADDLTSDITGAAADIEHTHPGTDSRFDEILRVIGLIRRA